MAPSRPNWRRYLSTFHLLPRLSISLSLSRLALIPPYPALWVNQILPCLQWLASSSPFVQRIALHVFQALFLGAVGFAAIKLFSLPLFISVTVLFAFIALLFALSRSVRSLIPVIRVPPPDLKHLLENIMHVLPYATDPIDARVFEMAKTPPVANPLLERAGQGKGTSVEGVEMLATINRQRVSQQKKPKAKLPIP
jgi:hypothetical protein